MIVLQAVVPKQIVARITKKRTASKESGTTASTSQHTDEQMQPKSKHHKAARGSVTKGTPTGTIGQTCDTGPTNLHFKNHVVFLDMDNWNKTLNDLLNTMREDVAFWCFFGEKNAWKEPIG